MEHNHGGLVQSIFLSKWVICRFQPLIFQGVFCHSNSFFGRKTNQQGEKQKKQRFLSPRFARFLTPPGIDVKSQSPIPIGSMYGIFTYMKGEKWPSFKGKCR